MYQDCEFFSRVSNLAGSDFKLLIKLLRIFYNVIFFVINVDIRYFEQ